MAVTFLAPVLHLFCLCFLSQDFSDPPIRSGIAFPALDSGLGPVTCFDWWDVSTCDISRGLKPACDRLAFWQVYYRERKASLPGAVPSAGPQKEQAWSRPGPTHGERKHRGTHGLKQGHQLEPSLVLLIGIHADDLWTWEAVLTVACIWFWGMICYEALLWK